MGFVRPGNRAVAPQRLHSFRRGNCLSERRGSRVFFPQSRHCQGSKNQTFGHVKTGADNRVHLIAVAFERESANEVSDSNAGEFIVMSFRVANSRFSFSSRRRIISAVNSISLFGSCSVRRVFERYPNDIRIFARSLSGHLHVYGIRNSASW
jgi:hypothetical protein